MRLATLYRFLAQAANANQSAGRIPSDCKAIFTALRINFRKAGANYSPLQQNHSNRTINCHSNPLEITAPNQSIHSPSKPVNS
jgi:hypothetical protein